MAPRAGSPAKSGCCTCCPQPSPAPRQGSPAPATGRWGSCRRPIFCLLPLGICFILWAGERTGAAVMWERPPQAQAPAPTRAVTGSAASPSCFPDSPSGPAARPKPPLRQLSSARALRHPPLLLPHLRSQKWVIGEGQEAAAGTPAVVALSPAPVGHTHPGTLAYHTCWSSEP